MEENLKWAQSLQLYMQATDEEQESREEEQESGDCTHCVDGALYRRESFKKILLTPLQTKQTKH